MHQRDWFPRARGLLGHPRPRRRLACCRNGTPELFLPAALQQRGNFFSIFVNNGVHVAEITGVTILQATVRVWFGKCDLMSQSMKLLVNAAIISRRTIPVRRRDAGAKDEDPHREISWQICISCCARCAQVWRSRMVCNPFSASW